nr:MAG TPA: Inhibitor of TRAP, regulated by-TRAP, AT, TRAP, tryptophan RNA-binding [Caudoviricetes sp.]
MFSDMDDMYFTNPSEADSIIDEATDRLRDLIRNDVKCVIDAYNKALREKYNLESDIARLNWEKQRIEDDIEAAKAKAEDVKNNYIPSAYINKFVSKYTNGYGPGDKVWAVVRDFNSNPCTLCDATGYVPAKMDDGTEFRAICPKCNGRKTVDNSKYYVSPDKIECVNMRLNFTEKEVSENCWEPLSIVLAKAGGINPDVFFRTEAEAQAKADELNKKEAEKANG